MHLKREQSEVWNNEWVTSVTVGTSSKHTGIDGKSMKGERAGNANENGHFSDRFTKKKNSYLPPPRTLFLSIRQKSFRGGSNTTRASFHWVSILKTPLQFQRLNYSYAARCALISKVIFFQYHFQPRCRFRSKCFAFQRLPMFGSNACFSAENVKQLFRVFERARSRLW